MKIASRTLTRILLPVALAAVLLAACSPQAPAAPTVTSTPDPCAPENIVTEVKKVNDLQRAFDDASQLAAVTQFNQMPTVIPPMQDIRRQAQDQQVPPCLVTLKTLQLQEMNASINTFLTFMAGGAQNPNKQLLSQGIALANGLHQQYNQELAIRIGATYVPPAQPTGSGTTGTPGTTVPAAGTPSGSFVTNAGTTTVNLRASPSMDAQTLGLLEVNQSASAVGKTTDGQWIQVADQAGNKAWVFASQVKVTGGDALPVVTP
jgi:hypothetical protein